MKKHNGDANMLASAVTALCDEALARFNAGDVPGDRATTDPKTIEARKLASVLMSKGWTMDQILAAMENPPHGKKSKAA